MGRPMRAHTADGPALSGGPGRCFLSLAGITKRFGGVLALDDIHLEVNRGEVLGLLGDNGAGKSTLVKIISGVLEPTEGSITCESRPVRIASPKVAHQLGIETVFQDLALIPNLPVADNFFIGRERTFDLVPRLIRVLRTRAMERDAAETLKRLDIHIPSLRTNVDSLSGGQRQAIAIARAIRWKANLVILDEPTAALSVPEQTKVLELTRQLAGQGVAVIYITHNMDDVIRVTDRIAVLHRGRKAAELRTADTDQNEIVHLIMSGRR
jgi:ABC-type sugar transport system ATPase subunit